MVDFNFNYLTDEELEQLFSKVKDERKERALKKRESKEKELNKFMEKVLKIITEYNFTVEIHTDEENCINERSWYEIFD